ncbi:hypothetical protein [Staphylospora marina]|uniref:hypothetical protein n=1 Tax=Staphylospora marina TaxID=2490858 RepID=UPI000F5BCCCE|nr:hypothetical protein [Staphylospora marina]
MNGGVDQNFLLELVEAIEQRLKPRFDEVNQRLDRIEERLDRIEERLDDVAETVTYVVQDVYRLKHKVGVK